jgi:hypothetical protein
MLVGAEGGIVSDASSGDGGTGMFNLSRTVIKVKSLGISETLEHFANLWHWGQLFFIHSVIIIYAAQTKVGGYMRNTD